jgi:hypothetical protein
MRKFFKMLVVAVVAMAAVAVAATPAQATVSQCPTGVNVYCVWSGWNHPGAPTYYWTWSGGSGGFCVNYGPGLNDNVDSLALRTGRSVTQYRDANCSGNAVSFHYSQISGNTPWYGSCGGWAWACVTDGAGGYLPSSAWIIK